MNSEVAWVLVSSGTQVQLQIILDPDYLSDYLSVSCDYDKKYEIKENVIVLKRKKMFLFEKFDKNVQFNFLFLEIPKTFICVGVG